MYVLELIWVLASLLVACFRFFAGGRESYFTNYCNKHDLALQSVYSLTNPGESPSSVFA
jgi:hypothetical protein